MARARPLGVLAALVALPLVWVGPVRQAVMGARSLDLIGHVWTIWSGIRSPDLTRSTYVAWPDGADLLPILGGWLDIFLGVGAARLFGLEAYEAFNLVWALYAVVAGLGGYALARAFGAGPLAALVGGLLLQLDGFVLWHAGGGRLEQAGLGFVALALAGARRSWTAPGRALPLLTGLAGAAVVYVSWEHAMLLAAAMALLLPAFLRTPAAPGAPRRWALAAGTTALLAGPWAILFVLRCAAIRGGSEGVDKLAWATKESAGLLHWFTTNGARPSLGVLLCLLPLGWTRRPDDGPLARAALIGLGLSLVLALGPSPGLYEGGDLLPGNWGPWAALQSLPLLSWFHTPIRLLATFSLVGVVAAALLVERLRAAKGPLAASALGLLLVGGAVAHARYADLWPVASWRWQPREALTRLADLPVQGALLDLPAVKPGTEVIPYQLDQFDHGRPILYHMTLPHLTREPLQERFGGLPFIAWLISTSFGESGPPPDDIRPDLRTLRAAGVGVLVLHTAQISLPARRPAALAVERALGAPVSSGGARWAAWDLSTLDD